MMSIDELLTRLSLGEALKHREGYTVSPEIYNKMKEAIDYYLDSGEVFVNRYNKLQRVENIKK